MYKNKVYHITTVHPPFDVRIFHKECKTLVKAGYEVFLIAQYDKEEIVDGINIIPLPKVKVRFLRILFLPIKALNISLKVKADIYHFHDSELIPVGLILKIFKRKVIYDVHENLPKDILFKKWIGNMFLRKLLSVILDKFERLSAIFFDKVVCTTPKIAERFPPNKTILIRNFPVLELVKKPHLAFTKKKKPIVIYAGVLNESRGIKNLIQAIGLLEHKVELWLLGYWQEDRFRKECENLIGWEDTKYLGYKSLEEVYSYMKISDIGIVPLLPIYQNLESLPTKVFEYMATGLPVIMSNFPYWLETFKDCALFCDPNNPKDIADKIEFLLKNPEKVKELRQNGEEFLNKNNWEEEGKKLLFVYKDLISGCNKEFFDKKIL